MSKIASTTLASAVDDALETYFKGLQGETPVALYEMVMLEVEKTLIKNIMQQSNGNQSQATKMLGINRNTLRAKLVKFGML